MTNIIESMNYDESVISLWQEAFGDTEEDIHFFIENCKNKSILTLFCEHELTAMLFLVDAVVDCTAYKYVYAAGTFKKYRGRGYMSALLNYAVKSYKNVLLIPADDELVRYYRKRNFNKLVKIDNIEFNECSEIKEYLFEGCSLKAPFALAYLER